MAHFLGARSGALSIVPTPSLTAVARAASLEPIPELVFAATARFAMRYSAPLIRALMPVGVPGTYLMFVGTTPVYVGRSDTCLRTRLTTHALLGVATHVSWEPTKTAFHAFVLECDWYHRLEKYSSGFNVIHPARSGGSERVCAFCVDDSEALRVTLSALYKREE